MNSLIQDIDDETLQVTLENFSHKIQQITEQLAHCEQQIESSEQYCQRLGISSLTAIPVSAEAAPKPTRFKKLVKRFNHITEKLKRLKEAFFKLKSLFFSSAKTAYLVTAPLTVTAAVVNPAVFRTALTVIEHVESQAATVLDSGASYSEILSGLNEVMTDTIVNLDQKVAEAEEESRVTCAADASGNVSCQEVQKQLAGDDGLHEKITHTELDQLAMTRARQQTASMSRTKLTKTAQASANKSQAVSKSQVNKVVAQRVDKATANVKDKSQVAAKSTTNVKTDNKTASTTKANNQIAVTQSSQSAPKQNNPAVNQFAQSTDARLNPVVDSAIETPNPVSEIETLVKNDQILDQQTSSAENNNSETPQTTRSPVQTLIALTSYLPDNQVVAVATELSKRESASAAEIAGQIVTRRPAQAKQIAEAVKTNAPELASKIQAAVDLAVTQSTANPVSPAK